MKKHLLKISLIAILLLVFQIQTIKVWAQANPQSTGPIGSQLAYGINEDIKYWNGTVWVAIPSGLPGQTLSFINGVPTWANNPNGITTNAVTNINGTTATCGGHIASSSGSPITAKGVCWSTNHNPTITDAHTSDDIGKGNFTSFITGITAGTYYVRAYATNSAGTAYGNEVSFIIAAPITNVTDYDGNIYDTVVIGTQTWMKQNLKVTHYRNGDAIPNVTDNTAWSNLATGAYADYNNTPSNSTTYGRLYNWYTVVDTRNLCPTGWHVPSDAEWTTLTNYLGGESIAGGKLKEAGTTHWNSPNTAATNETGFTALPAGYRVGNGTYNYFGKYGYWWSSTEGNTAYAWTRLVYYYFSGASRNYDGKTYGFSVRCLRD